MALSRHILSNPLQRRISLVCFLIMKFLVPYLVVALLGTAGVYYGIQPLWLRMGWPLPAPAPAHATATTSAPASAPKDPYFRPATPAESPAQAPALTRVITAPGPTPVTPPPPVTTSGKPEAPTTEPKPSTETATTTPAASSGNPPLTQGSKSWGMTLTSAAYYALSGENRGKLAGGSIIDIEDSRNTSRGDMSVGRVERDNTMVGPYLVANVDLVRFNVARSEVPAESIATLKQYYQLKGALDVRLTVLKKQAASANPYAAAYGEAVQNYNNFGTREKQLTSRRDSASGAERMKLVDQLREMIPESQRLLRAVEDAKAKYNKWKAANPGATAVDTSSDPLVQDLQRQIAALEPQVKTLIQ